MLSLLDRVPAFDLLPIIVHSAWYGYITSIFLHTIRPPSKMVHESIQVPWRKPHGVCVTPFRAGKWEQGIKKKVKKRPFVFVPSLRILIMSHKFCFKNVRNNNVSD